MYVYTYINMYGATQMIDSRILLCSNHDLSFNVTTWKICFALWYKLLKISAICYRKRAHIHTRACIRTYIFVRMLATYSNFSITSPAAFKQLLPNGSPIQIFGKSNVNSLNAFFLSVDAEHPSVKYFALFIYMYNICAFSPANE